MAREYARIMVSIWADEDFRALDSRTQRLFFMLISQPSMSTCGVQSFAPKRWALLAPDTTPRLIERQVALLERPRLVVVDRNTEELLVRSHVRYDRAMRTENVAKALVRTFRQVASHDLQKVIVEELRRAYEEPGVAEWAGWKLPEVQLLLGLES